MKAPSKTRTPKRAAAACSASAADVKAPAPDAAPRPAKAPGPASGRASLATEERRGSALDALRLRLQEAQAQDSLVTLAHAEATALLEVAEAASAMFETTLDRNVARRRMERLQVALARLKEPY